MQLQKPHGVTTPGSKATLLVIGTFALAFLAGGCAPGPFNVEVSLDEKDTGLRDKTGTVKTIEVNLIAINDSELERWEQMSVNSFWEVNSPIRASAKKYVMTFGQERPSKQTLLETDAIWKKWIDERGARYLVVLGYLPWIQNDQPGAADPRRLILPLERGKWEWSAWGANTVPIQIGTGGITPLRQPNK